MDREFNLLKEKWILVMRSDGTVESVSLPDALVHANEYASLAGETATQDFAMLRLLEAVMHATFYRFDEDGEESEIGPDDADVAMERWSAIWNLGRIPEEPIVRYLDQYEDRFWLRSERPFYQANAASIGTEYTGAKLNGEIGESSNKVRMFSSRVGWDKDHLSYAEGARWLLSLNGYDDTSSKAKGKNLPSPGASWLGKIGPIAAEGSNLFETIMLNFVILNLNGDEPWESVTPVWELDQPREGERTEIVLKNDQAQLLTLQSRRVLLTHEGGMVSGYRLLGGDFFPKENSFAEQMTIWAFHEDKKTGGWYTPRRHDPAVKAWREFSSIVETSEGKKRPGVVDWGQRLYLERVLKRDYVIRYKTIGVQYGDKDFFQKELIDDSIAFHLNLLSDVGGQWRMLINDEIKACGDLAYYVSGLQADIEMAAGHTDFTKGRDDANVKEQFYFRIDMPFRKWLETLDADQDDTVMHDKRVEWRKEAAGITRTLGLSIVNASGASAMGGRTVKQKVNGVDRDVFVNAPIAYNKFLARINKYMVEEGSQNGNTKV